MSFYDLLSDASEGLGALDKDSGSGGYGYNSDCAKHRKHSNASKYIKLAVVSLVELHVIYLLKYAALRPVKRKICDISIIAHFARKCKRVWVCVVLSGLEDFFATLGADVGRGFVAEVDVDGVFAVI